MYTNIDDFKFHHYKDGLKIFIGSYRIDEFIRLLQKVVDRDFDQLTLGEIWCADDLLTSFEQNIKTLKEGYHNEND